MIFVLTGRGKGKTTCAVGMGVRAAGAGQKVLMVQFLKTGASSENKAVKQIKNFDAKAFGRKGFGPYTERDVLFVKKGIEFLKKSAPKYQFIIMDEINLVLRFGLIDIKEVLSFLDRYCKNKHLVLTGRGCVKKIIDKADLVTDFREVRHYLKKNIETIKGIEF